MDNSILEKYAEKAKQIEILTEEAKALKAQAFEEIIKNNLQIVKLDSGTFSVAKVKSWTYSDEVKTKAEELKKLKKSEEETGKAVAEESQSLRFLPK